MGGLARRRLHGLDGLRALAVLGVVAFHLDSRLAPGGFLGVDVFFVISGFLITRLITLEIIDTGTLRLSGFYVRRARRLLPAVLVLLGAVSLGSWLMWSDQRPTLTGAVLSSLGYATNWWLIADHQSYFVSSGRPSMLQHLWSLAIEEQFYIVWSAALLGAAVFLGRNGRRITGPRLARVVAPLALLLCVGGTAWSTVLAVRSDLPYGASTSRVYFGTDTHAAGLFLGAMAGVLAAATATRTVVAPPTRRGTAGLATTDVLGLLAIGALSWQFLHVDEFRPALYRGGFTFVALLALIAVLCAVRRHSRLGNVLELRPLRWVGERSYSIYLWHWPIAIVTRPGYDVHGNETALNLARLGLILVVGHLSYRWIETPIRSGRVSVRALAGLARPRAGLAFARLRVSVWMSTPRSRWVPRLPRVSTVLGLGVAVAASAALVVATQAPPQSASVALDLGGRAAAAEPLRSGTAAVSPPPQTDAASPASTAPGAAAPAPTAPGAAAPTASAPAAVPPSASPAPPAASAPAPVLPPAPPPSISAFGDSVLLGAAPALSPMTARFDLDAVVGIQASKVLDAIMSARNSGGLAPIVLIHVGNNGIISPGQLTNTLTALADRSRVILVNDKLARDWQDPNNSTLASVAPQFPNVVLIDWYAISTPHPEWFVQDGIHLNSDGRAAYASLVLTACR